MDLQQHKDSIHQMPERLLHKFMNERKKNSRPIVRHRKKTDEAGEELQGSPGQRAEP